MAAKDFTGKVVLVTGSSSGIGEHLVLTFAKLGAKVVVHGRNAERTQAVADNCTAQSPNGTKALAVVADVSKHEDCVRLVHKTIEAFGQIDVLINNAGHSNSQPTTIADAHFAEQFDRVLAANLRSAAVLTNLCAPHLIKTKGNVVNMSSTLGNLPEAGGLSYCVSKAGMNMLTKATAKELASVGVRANAVAPAAVETPIWGSHGMPDAMAKAIYDHCKLTYPLGRAGVCDDVTKACLFLASDDASFVTGVVLNVDGGFSVTHCGVTSDIYGDMICIAKPRQERLKDN